MILDYNSHNGQFVVRTPDATLARKLMHEHGLDFSLPASTNHEKVLFTSVPEAAVTFWDSATDRARNVLSGLRSRISLSQAPSSGRHIDVPPDKELWGFQKASLDYALTVASDACLIADQPGLGKTPQAVAFANEIQAKRVLCIVPANVRLQWAEKIFEWSTLPGPITVHVVTNSRNGLNPFAHYTVVSYELATSLILGAMLAAERYDLLIIDEAHYLKTPDARRTRAIFGGGVNRDFPPIADSCDVKLALTGTPLPNRPREAYTLTRAFCWDAIDWMSEDKFRDRFNPSLMLDTKSGKKRIDERTGRTAELQNRLRGSYMTRHLKREVMTQLEYPVYDLVYLDETKAIRAALEAERMLDIDPNTLEGADLPIMGDISTVRRLMGEAMAPGAADYVKTVLDGGEDKVVVMGWHISALNILETKLEQYGVVRLDGRVGSPGLKRERVNEFRRNPHKRVFLGNILAAGVGVDGLQDVANHIILSEPDWVPGNNQQAIDRLDRGGQKRTVLADICVVRGSFAERICAAFLRKAKIIDKALDHKHTIDDW
jgi:SWI/SNF-related matrix-associated actin-dependent regulator 1 of chromatin subfamily A